MLSQFATGAETPSISTVPPPPKFVPKISGQPLRASVVAEAPLVLPGPVTVPYNSNVTSALTFEFRFVTVLPRCLP